MLMEDLVVVLVLMELVEVLVAVEGTLVEAVDKINGTAVQEGEDLTTPEQIRKMNAVIKQLVMVR